MRALLDAAGGLDRDDPHRRPYRLPLITVLAFSRLRIGELLALCWKDVSLADCTITVREGKTRAVARVVDLQPEAYDHMAAWRAATRHDRANNLVF